MSVSIDGAGSLIGVDQGLNIVGLTTLTGGIILDDSISHIGDTDTKIRFPAADTFTVETAGSERLRISSDGKVVISRFDDGSAGPYLELYNNSESPADNDYTGSINFKNNNSASEEIVYAEIRGISRDITDGSEDGEIQFHTERQGSFSERVRICADQATGSNESRLDIIGGNVNVAAIDEINGSLRFRSNDASVNSTENVGAQISAITEASNGAYVGMGFYTFQQGSRGLAESLRITNAGRLLLGTTTEGEANADDFTIATSAHTGMTIRSGTANRGNIYFSDGTSGDAEYRGYITYDHDGDRFKFGTANSDRLVITSAGKIGFGVASPAQMMEITNTGSTGSQIQLRDTSTGTGSSDGLRVGYNGSGGQMWNFENTYIRFATNNAERVRITPEGRLHLGNSGHGTTSVGGQEISGQNYSALLKLYDTRANIWGMQMRRDTGTGPNGIFVRAGNTSSNYSLYVCGTNESDTHLVCRGDGNVGVNTKDPSEHLHIVGAVRRDTPGSSNVKFLEFSFELPSGTTTTIATVTGPVVSSMAIAKFEYAGLYDYSGSSFYSGVEMASLRRSSNNSAYTYLQNSEIHAGGNNSSYQPNIFWQNGSNNTSDLMITTGNYVLIMGTIRITTYNLGLNRVISI